MTKKLARIVEEKESVFQRPSSKRDIAGGKEVIEVDKYENIVPALAARSANQAIIITEDVSLYDSTQYYSSQNFSKRGPLVHLTHYRTKKGHGKNWKRFVFNRRASPSILERDQVGPTNARIAAEELGDYKDRTVHHVAFAWYDPEGFLHTLRPTAVLEGHRLHQFARTQTNIQEKVRFLNPREYSARDSPYKTINALVPSRSPDKPYEVTIEHVVDFLDDPRRFVEWTRLRTRHDCAFKRNDFTLRSPHQISYDAHECCAIINYERRVAEEHGRVPLLVVPLITEPMLKLHISAAYNAMKRVQDKEGRIHHQPLSFPEIDTLLMDAWKLYGNKKTFYAGPPTKGQTRMRDYDWSINGPGMPF